MTHLNSVERHTQLIDVQIKEVLSLFPSIALAVIFGSVAEGRQRTDSDLDIAVASAHPLVAEEK